MIVETPTYKRVPGKCIFLAGSDLYHGRNMTVHHVARLLVDHVERLDLVGYVNFYGGPPAPAMRRLRDGLRNIVSDRVRESEEGTVRRIIIRKIHLPQVVDALAQGLWVFANLRPRLADVYDVGIVYHPENALLMALLKREGRVRHFVYYDVDNFAAFVRPGMSALVGRQERACIQTADGVVSVSRPLVSLRLQQGARVVRLVPNGVEFDRFYQAYLHRTPHPPTLIYAGALDGRWGVDLAIRAMPRLRERLAGIRMLVVGTGRAGKELRSLAASLGVAQSVDFIGLVAYGDLPGLMAEADLGVATSREDLFRQYASPMKLCEYMAAGLPVICSGGGEAESIIRESGAGRNIPFSPEAFSDAAAALFLNPDEMDACREAGFNYARSRSWESLVKQMAGFLAEVAGQA